MNSFGRKTSSRIHHRTLAAIIITMLALPGLNLWASEQVELLSRELEDGSYEFFAVSDHVIPVWLRVEFRELINMESSAELPFGGLVEPTGEEQYLFTLRPSSDRGRRGYSVSYRYARGDPREVNHDDEHLYLLPFAHGEKFRVTQGYYGSFTHFGENTYAIDFDMDEGTPVHAARDGVVVEVKQDSHVGGLSARYATEANYVLVMHSDGSFANYVHLRPQGAAVEVGARVSAGDLVGYSGNTGQSSGPHLHFDVRIPTKEGRMKSIPTLFLNHDGSAIELSEHEFYYAYHPGGEDFQVVLGRELTANDFAGHRETISRSDRIEFRTEDVDLTYILFIGNGFDHEVELEIDIQMSGVRSDKGLPITMTLEPQTERFLTLLRAVPGATRLQFSPRVRYRPVE